MKMTQRDVDIYNLRHAAKAGPSTSADWPEPCVDESELHSEIAQECRRRGWLAVHSRMDARTTTALGVPDFLIFRSLDVLLIEAKAKNKKPTVAQNAWHAHARKLGHEVHIVRSFVEFLALLCR